MSLSQSVFATPSPRIRRLPVDRPWLWLAGGWRDMVEVPRLSLGFGVLLAGASALATFGIWIAGSVYLILPLAAGFFFVAPILAIGVYEISRRRESGHSILASDMVLAFRRNGGQIALMGLLLMLVHLAWVRIAMLLFALFFERAHPSLDQLVEALFFSPASLTFLIVGTLVGAALAAFTFAISAISIPMLLDRDIGVGTAIATSWVAVHANWQAMALWAGLIVVFVSLGFATFYVGLVVAVPLVGHASWHAYRDLVE